MEVRMEENVRMEVRIEVRMEENVRMEVRIEVRMEENAWPSHCSHGFARIKAGSKASLEERRTPTI